MSIESNSRMMTRGPIGSLYKCPRCGKTSMVLDENTGEQVCTNCGYVASEKIVSEGPEWRNFTKEQGDENRSRVGTPSTLARDDMGLSTVIGLENRDVSGRALQASMKATVERLRTWDKRSRVHPSLDRNLRQAFSELERLAQKINAGNAVVEKAAYIYRKAVEKKLVRGRSISEMIAASLYAALRDAEIAEFPLPSPYAGPDGIALGPDGNVWFSETEIGKIGRITPTGHITEFGDGISFGARPLSIVVRDGALWFSEAAGNRIGRICVDGKVTEFPIPSPDSQPRAMAAHPDGSIWFVETSTNALGRLDRDGRITEHKVPTPDSSLRGVAVGADGDLWYTANAVNKIGRMAPDGTVRGEYDIPTPASGARCITVLN